MGDDVYYSSQSRQFRAPLEAANRSEGDFVYYIPRLTLEHKRRALEKDVTRRSGVSSTEWHVMPPSGDVTQGCEPHTEKKLRRTPLLLRTMSFEDDLLVGKSLTETERKRASSLPDITDGMELPAEYYANIYAAQQSATQGMSDQRLFALMTNITHIILGIALTQLGIVGTWYERYMNFAQDHLRHIVYICILYIITGVYGTFIVSRKLTRIKAHKNTYIILTALSIVASCFIVANGIRIVISDTYRSNHTVILLFDGLILGLSCVEIPAFFIGLHLTVLRKRETLSRQQSQQHLVPEEDEEKPRSPPSWSSVFSVILNVAHIVLGLCIIELGMVGMIYRRFMKIDTSGLCSVVFVSISFVSVGIMGLYNQSSGRTTIKCNRAMYTGASLVAVGCATVILSFVSLAMSGQYYYAGFEAIVAFDVMILSMSGIELGVGLAALILGLIPVCAAHRLTEQETSATAESDANDGHSE